MRLHLLSYHHLNILLQLLILFLLFMEGRSRITVLSLQQVNLLRSLVHHHLHPGYRVVVFLVFCFFPFELLSHVGHVNISFKQFVFRVFDDFVEILPLLFILNDIILQLLSGHLSPLFHLHFLLSKLLLQRIHLLLHLSLN